MNYDDIIEKLTKLKDNYHTLYIHQNHMRLDPDQSRLLHDEATGLLGELEEVITRLAGVREIAVEPYGSARCVFPNYIEATLLTHCTTFATQGYQQLLKLIGKIQQQKNDPVVPKSQPAVTNLIRALGQFRECCQYIKDPPTDETAVQDIIWIMLRSQFDRLDREDSLPKFGVKGYKPDFGVPDLRVLVEAKFIGIKTKIADIQEEILADVPGYLNEMTNYDAIIVIVYDAAHKLRDSRKFVEDVRSVEGIVDVLVIPGIA